jgi:predicted nucleic acid-binding protein
VRCYFDTAYIVKCYVNEPGHRGVRAVARRASGLYSSAWCIAELACAFHRHVREGSLTQEQAIELRNLFLSDLRQGVWVVFPVSGQLLLQVESATANLPPTMHLRAGDAVHLVTARHAGFSEIWTNDRHLLAAAPHFGLTGRSV